MTTKGLYSYNNGKYLWGGCFTQESLPFFAKALPDTFWQIECLYCSDQRKWDWFMMKSFLPWQMKVYIHTKMVDTYGAADSPKEAFIFLPRHNLLRFGELNASTAQIRGYKIIFFLVKRGGCFTPESLPFCAKASPVTFLQIKNHPFFLLWPQKAKWFWFH